MSTDHRASPGRSQPNAGSSYTWPSAIATISTSRTRSPGGSCQILKPVFTVTYKLISMTKCADTVCGRTTRVVRQKMGHRHEHQRALPIVSLSKYTEFSFVWLNTDARTNTEREREWHNQPLERQVSSFLCHKLLMPSCCQSVNCISKWRPPVRPWLIMLIFQGSNFGIILFPETLNVLEILVVLCLYTFWCSTSSHFPPFCRHHCYTW